MQEQIEVFMEENKILYETQLELIGNDETEAEAAVSLNPYFQWAKIVVTDDKPNLNNQRIPLEEFGNLIRTGLNTPIKMTFSRISSGHKEAMGSVIGTIAHLTQEEDKLIALAALWKKERPNDIEMLKDMYTRGTPPNVSWEVSFAESQKDEIGVESLYKTALTGLTVVSNPAYDGRTQFVAMASRDEEEDQVEELDQLKQEKAELETQLAELKSQVESSVAELEELRLYKQTSETAKAEAEKFASLKAKFSEAGIEKDEEYFDSNKDKLLALTNEALDFMIQEMVSFAAKNSEASTTNVTVPPFSTTVDKKPTPKELGKLLREKYSK